MTNPAVVVRLAGGLGNQLFQYAFGRALALRNGVPLVLDSVSGFLRDQYGREFELQHYAIEKHCSPATGLINLPLSRWRRQWWRAAAATQPLSRRHYVRERFPSSLEPSFIDLRIRRATYFDGYWQHEGYFRDVRAQLLQDLTIVARRDSPAAIVASGIDPNITVCVHVRCLRHAAAGNHENPRLDIDPDYYRRAIIEVCRRVAKPSFLVFSDHPAWVKSQRIFPPSAEFLENDGSRTVHEDTWLMSQCRNFIIGNSTFSWWGAWLSRSNDKFVVAPRSGINRGIYSIPPEWHLA